MQRRKQSKGMKKLENQADDIVETEDLKGVKKPLRPKGDSSARKGTEVSKNETVLEEDLSATLKENKFNKEKEVGKNPEMDCTASCSFQDGSQSDDTENISDEEDENPGKATCKSKNKEFFKSLQASDYLLFTLVVFLLVLIVFGVSFYS